MASINTLRVKEGIESRAAEVRKRVQEEVAKSHPSKPLTSVRWLGRRTKGLPFSRMKLVDVAPATGRGRPAIFALKHPTRGGGVRIRPATPLLVDVFFPALPENLRASMLGA
ncbi:hypothetical protein [Paracoccus yeei]|uniref:hypothetical protein n=1 Tax=Paracoccus yeei TaxID=147645 RepID=UPI00174B1679|nr:hypothetical protein [Paracoccus yeei]